MQSCKAATYADVLGCLGVDGCRRGAIFADGCRSQGVSVALATSWEGEKGKASEHIVDKIELRMLVDCKLRSIRCLALETLYKTNKRK
jgi:hypothetical protein